MRRSLSYFWLLLVALLVAESMHLRPAAADDAPAADFKVNVPPVSSDPAVSIDYDIVYVRAPRFGDEKPTRWAEVMNPLAVDAGTDLMLLHPDGSEELLVAGGVGAVADPFVSFDGQWVYYAKFHDQSKQLPWGFPAGGSDIYKIHLGTRKIVRLTFQERTPNTGVLSGQEAQASPVFNLGPCPAPRGRVVFTSNRNLFEAPKGYTRGSFQLYAMDDDGQNAEMIGFLNIASALHPAILRDGRVMFSSYESQGLRDLRNWGLWFIYPDGTGWGPLVSSFQRADAYHFHTQLSNGSIVFEAYYNANNFGFGTLYRMPSAPEKGYAAFGPADRNDARNPQQANPRRPRFSFTPHGLESLTRFVSSFDSPAALSDPQQPESPRVGKFTHPCGAPDNHLLAVWSPGAVNSNGSYRKYWYPRVDAGLYLIRNGEAIDKPGQMLLIKNDPRYNEQWPRPVVHYRRIHGVDEPRYQAPPANDGTASPHLPAGCAFGLVGTSSMYKRESVTGGAPPTDSVTAVNPRQDKLRGLRPCNSYRPEVDHWFAQGADCGLYDNADIHAVRILAQEPTTQRRRMFWNWGAERYRILGEAPVRKFNTPAAGKGQPLDPDGNPDTSFLARIPADTSFTFQTLDKHGMALNMAQTWHQTRPGEIRHDCGGCHAHSQQPTAFADTFAARPDYQVLDMALQTPLLTSRERDESDQQWDEGHETGLRFAKSGAVNVEFFRDVVPIFKRSCCGCHSKDQERPAANLVLDDLEPVPARGGGGMFREPPGGKVPATFALLAMGATDRHGQKHVNGGWVLPQMSRDVRVYQSRRSLLAWKVLGLRTDGWSNDDFPTAATPGDAKTLQIGGKPVDSADRRNLELADIDLTGQQMPPAEAVASGQVKPLTDEDRRTLFRWIDLGCPLDLKSAANQPNAAAGSGWMDDETRPTLTITSPRAGRNPRVDRLLIGLHDYYTGLDMDSFTVTADFEIAGVPAGKNLAPAFRQVSPGVYALELKPGLTSLSRGLLDVAIKDRQGNQTRLRRTFSVAP